jgi:hypothetical protein
MVQGLCMFDAEHRLVLCNDRYLAMFGVSRESVVPGIGVLELFQQVECAGVFAAGPAERMHQYYRARVSAFVGFGLRDLIAKQLHQIEYVKTFLSLDVPTRFIIPYLKKTIQQLDGCIEEGKISLAISRLFGSTRFFTKAGRIGLCVEARPNYSPEPGLALIEKIYITRNEMFRFFDLDWTDPLVTEIARKQIQVSSEFLVDAAQSTIARVGKRNRFLSESFRCSAPDDKWLAEATLFDLSCEKITLYRNLLQSLEKKSHDKLDLAGHFFRKSLLTNAT